MSKARPITLSDTLARCKENRLAYEVLALQDGVTIVVTQRGGRILGPFISEHDEGVFWASEAFASSAAFAAFLDSGSWNLGGERIWIAPELVYNVKNRLEFWETYDLPGQVDPGNYRIRRTPEGAIELRQDMHLQTHGGQGTLKALRLERSIRQAANPLRHASFYKDVMKDVMYAGYDHTLTLREESADQVMSEAWDLIQVKPGGKVIIPSLAGAEFTDYYEPIDAGLQQVFPNHVQLHITGTRRYKVGYKSTSLVGRIGYVNDLDESRRYLLVRSFFNNPSAVYAEEPARLPGCRGHSIHVYNDDGSFGGFGELECTGQTIGGDTGRSSSADQMLLWLYAGDRRQIAAIARHLLGVEP